MRSRGFHFGSISVLSVVMFLVPALCWITAASLLVPKAVLADDSSSSSSSDDDDDSGTYAGVAIDAGGVLHKKSFNDNSGQLMKERVVSARATLDPKLATYSKLRKISLNRLEQAIVDHQGTLTDEMRYLAGLLRVRYVFYYPDSKDIVLAGPAEGFAPNPAGRVIGITSRRPVVQLQDLIVALRSFPSGGKPVPTIGCSIDATQDGLASMRNYLQSNRPNPSNVGPFMEGLRNALGYQVVTINGVSPKSHFAQVLVEADYRMKLIGIGLEKPPVKMASYVDRVKLSEVAHNAMQRWFFVPDYQCVRQSEDGNAMELVGDGVKLVGEEEVVAANGERRAAAPGRVNKASQGFVTSFTKKYPELAEHSSVYAELRNLVDLSIAAAYIQEQDYCAKADWKMAFFGSEEAFPVELYDVPKTVETAVNAIGRGNTLGFPVGGGVNIEAATALQSDNLLSDEKGRVSKLRETVAPNLAKGQWWWD